MIEAENLTKFYGDRAAVKDLSFNVEKGEIVGLLGPNGAGKTTTMRMLTGYLPVDAGKAIVAGYNVADKPMEVRKRLGYLPETVPLYTEMPVRTYLDFTAKIRGVPANGRKRRVEEVMELCRIADVRDKIIGKLSRGYRQRVGLAQAIVHNPQVIILDEPTVGLDPRQIIEIRKVIRDLAGNHSMILSTHILPEVSAICDRVVIVNRGRVLVEDTLANLERRGAEGERLRLQVRANPEEAALFLQEWPGVVQVETVTPAEESETALDGSLIFDLKVQPGAEIREKLAAAVVSRGWGLLELKNIAPSLEEIFVQLITEDLNRLEAEEEVEAGGYAGDDDELSVQPLNNQSQSYDDEMDEPVEPAESEPVAQVVKTKRKAAPSFLSGANGRGAGNSTTDSNDGPDEEK
ncbi:MAG TPA: ATP-binding cassette domain-containing protein [Chloroflexia bacterium]|nr:ATP-binding cassette domain-containing protein [Chloroflexia bacterium]